MQTSKQQIVLSGIFVLGIIALGVDRFLLSDGISGPAQAAAQPNSPNVSRPIPPHPQPGATNLSQRLRAIALYQNLDLDLVSNAFSLDQRDAALRPEKKTEQMSTNERAFRDAHRLIGVIVDRSGTGDGNTSSSHTAFIETLMPGQLKPQIVRLIEGESIDGFTIIKLGLPGTDNASSPFIVLSRKGVTFRLIAADGD